MPESPYLDLIGVGAPVMDIVATVPEEFLVHAGGEKGGMVMIDTVEMERLLGLLPAKPALTPGGSAANTTFNAARLGLRTAFIGKLGGDEIAYTYEQRFATAGVDVSRFKKSDQPNARSLIMTTPDALRTMRTCLGAVMTFSPAEVSAADFAGARHVHIEGYVVFNQALADAIVNSARAAGCTIGLSFASFEVVGAARGWLLGQLEKGLSIVFANDDEARALFPDLPARSPEDYVEHVKQLASFGGTAAVTLGKDGAWIARGSEVHRIAPQKVVDLMDTNGAGDAWAAGFLSGFLRGRSLSESGAIASTIAAETVRHMGPIIPDLHWPTAAARAEKIAKQG